MQRVKSELSAIGPVSSHCLQSDIQRHGLKKLSSPQVFVGAYCPLAFGLMREKRKGMGTNVPNRLLYFCLIKTYPPTRITTAAPTAPATIAIVKSGCTSVVVVVVVVVSTVLSGPKK